MKRVFTNHDQVLHLWSSQVQDEARCKNVFFKGAKVWSYGHHYLLGVIHEVKGLKIAVINSYKYSPTTNKHICSAWHAVEHLVRVKSSDPMDINKGLLETQDRLMDELFGFFSRRKFGGSFSDKEGLPDYLLEEIFEFNSTCTRLKRKDLALYVEKDFRDLMLEHVKLVKERQLFLESPEMQVKREEKLQKAELAKIKKIQDEIQAWKRGGFLTANLRTLNRQLIRIKGDQVETSRGASVPLSEAKELLSKLMRNEAKQGDPIGSFTFNGINEGLVGIGCHKISLEEAKSVLITTKLELLECVYEK